MDRELVIAMAMLGLLFVLAVYSTCVGMQ